MGATKRNTADLPDSLFLDLESCEELIGEAPFADDYYDVDSDEYAECYRHFVDGEPGDGGPYSEDRAPPPTPSNDNP